MNDYLTPRRRHSSLFQRMQDEINKISKKLSAAKQHKGTHHPASAHKYTHSDFQQHLKRNASPYDDGAEETVRRSKPVEANSKQITKKMTFLKERTNHYNDSNTRVPIRKLKFGVSQPLNIQDNLYESLSGSTQVSKLLEQNKHLQNKLKKMTAVCEQQAFKIGYMRSENRENMLQLQSKQMQYKKQQLFLTKLVQGYRLKVNKYKHILNEQESIDLSLTDF